MIKYLRDPVSVMLKTEYSDKYRSYKVYEKLQKSFVINVDSLQVHYSNLEKIGFGRGNQNLGHRFESALETVQALGYMVHDRHVREEGERRADATKERVLDLKVENTRRPLYYLREFIQAKRTEGKTLLSEGYITGLALRKAEQALRGYLRPYISKKGLRYGIKDEARLRYEPIRFDIQTERGIDATNSIILTKINKSKFRDALIALHAQGEVMRLLTGIHNVIHNGDTDTQKKVLSINAILRSEGLLRVDNTQTNNERASLGVS